MSGINTPWSADDELLPGRDRPMPGIGDHALLATSMRPPYPSGSAQALFGMGCFWGAERCFWSLPGVYVTAVGYAAGLTPNPTYEEVCSGRTGHAEVVRVVFDPQRLAYAKLLRLFWSAHDPTQGMRQGNDRGTQYRSGIYTYGSTQLQQAEASRMRYQQVLSAQGWGEITTEILPAGPFYFAEPYHQQYLHHHPHGYCGLGGTGVPFPD